MSQELRTQSSLGDPCVTVTMRWMGHMSNFGHWNVGGCAAHSFRVLIGTLGDNFFKVIKGKSILREIYLQFSLFFCLGEYHLFGSSKSGP